MCSYVIGYFLDDYRPKCDIKSKLFFSWKKRMVVHMKQSKMLIPMRQRMPSDASSRRGHVLDAPRAVAMFAKSQLKTISFPRSATSQPERLKSCATCAKNSKIGAVEMLAPVTFFECDLWREFTQRTYVCTLC